MINKELYERIIHLANQVYKGEIDPLEVEIDRFINILREVDLEKLAYDLMYLDINALYGLSLILEAQSEAIKRKTQGLYLDAFMVRLKILNLDINSLANIIERVWRPPVELSILDEDDLLEAKIFFESIIRYKWTPPRKVEVDLKPVHYIESKEVSSMMHELYEELKKVSQFKWINYNDFISGGDKLIRAYILSFLINEGYVELKMDRINKKILIRPLKSRKIYKYPMSIPVVLEYV